MSVLDLLGTIELLDDRDRAALLASAGIESGSRRLARRTRRTRARLVMALRDVAARASASAAG